MNQPAISVQLTMTGRKSSGSKNIVKHILVSEGPAAHQKADHSGRRLIRQEYLPNAD
jgi:hypothetical protein